MAIQTLTSGNTGAQLVSKFNANFLELYNRANVYSVEEFGITAGVPFTEVEMNAMFAALPADATLVFSKGEYIYNSAATVYIQKNAHVEFTNNSKIDATGFTGTVFWYFTGTLGTFETITPSLGDITITISHTLALTLSRGDILWMSTTSAHGGDDSIWKGLKGSPGGEMTEVYSVNTVTNVVTLYEPIKYTYATGVRVCKMNFIEITIKGFQYYGTQTNSNTALICGYVKNLLIQDVVIVGAGAQSMFLHDCFNFKVERFISRDYQWNHGSGGNNYGIIMYHGTKGEITGCQIIGGRKAIDCSGIYMPTREILIHHNHLSSEAHTTPGEISVGHAIGSHPLSDHIWITDNEINTGLGMMSLNTVIRNNHLILSQGWLTTNNLIDMGFDGESDYQIIENNIIDSYANHGSNLIVFTCANFYARQIIIKNNVYNGRNCLVYWDSYPDGVNTDKVENFIIEGNISQNIENVYENSLLTLAGEESIFDLISIKNNVIHNGYGSHVAVAFDPPLTFTSGRVNKLLIQDNYFEKRWCMFQTNRATGKLADIYDVVLTNNYFRNNYSFVTTSPSYLTALGTIVAKNNVADNPLSNNCYVLTAPKIFGTPYDNPEINLEAYVTNAWYFTTIVKRYEDYIATVGGLTTGIIKQGSADIIVTSGNNDYICCLPLASINTIGTVIKGKSAGGFGFELRVEVTQVATVYINGVTTNVEAAIPSASSFEVTQIDTTNWLLKVWAADGTYSAPIPDAV